MKGEVITQNKKDGAQHVCHYPFVIIRDFCMISCQRKRYIEIIILHIF